MENYLNFPNECKTGSITKKNVPEATFISETHQKFFGKQGASQPHSSLTVNNIVGSKENQKAYWVAAGKEPLGKLGLL